MFAKLQLPVCQADFLSTNTRNESRGNLRPSLPREAIEKQPQFSSAREANYSEDKSLITERVDGAELRISMAPARSGYTEHTQWVSL